VTGDAVTHARPVSFVSSLLFIVVLFFIPFFILFVFVIFC